MTKWGGKLNRCWERSQTSMKTKNKHFHRQEPRNHKSITVWALSTQPLSALAITKTKSKRLKGTQMTGKWEAGPPLCSTGPETPMTMKSTTVTVTTSKLWIMTGSKRPMDTVAVAESVPMCLGPIWPSLTKCSSPLRSWIRWQSRWACTMTITMIRRSWLTSTTTITRFRWSSMKGLRKPRL